MKQNIRIAKALIRLAKSLLASDFDFTKVSDSDCGP